MKYLGMIGCYGGHEPYRPELLDDANRLTWLIEAGSAFLGRPNCGGLVLHCLGGCKRGQKMPSAAWTACPFQADVLKANATWRDRHGTGWELALHANCYVPVGDPRTAWRSRDMSRVEPTGPRHGKFWGQQVDELALATPAGKFRLLVDEGGELDARGWDDLRAATKWTMLAGEGLICEAPPFVRRGRRADDTGWMIDWTESGRRGAVFLRDGHALGLEPRAESWSVPAAMVGRAYLGLELTGGEALTGPALEAWVRNGWTPCPFDPARCDELEKLAVKYGG